MNLEGITLRIRNLFLPLVALSLAFTASYSFLNWLLVVKNGWIPLDEDIADTWLPGGLAWLLVLFLIQRRLRILNLRDKRKNLPILYHLAAVAVVAVPAIIAQGYVRISTGEVTHVADAAPISINSPSKFYVADNVCMHLNRPVSHAFVTSGRWRALVASLAAYCRSATQARLVRFPSSEYSYGSLTWTSRWQSIRQSSKNCEMSGRGLRNIWPPLPI
jgi:hypothetical protein